MRGIISFILAMQLITGCQSGAGGSPVTAEIPFKNEPHSKNIAIEGTIAKISDFLFSSAHAADGILIVNDYANPEYPKELKRVVITNQNTFSFIFKRDQVAGKLLKLQFISSESADLSREFLLASDGSEKEISAELSQETTARALLIERYLKKELSGRAITEDELIQSYFSHSSLDIKGLIELIGLDVLIRLMKDPDTHLTAADAFLDILESIRTGDLASSQDSLLAMAKILETTNMASSIYLLCDGNKGQVFFNGGTYEVYVKGIQEQVIRKFSGGLALGYAGNLTEGNKIISSLVDILSELSDQYGENLQAEIFFRSEHGEMTSCKLSGKSFDSGLAVSQKALELPVNFDALESISYSDKQLVDEFVKESFLIFKDRLEELRWLLEGASIDPVDKKRLLKQEFQRGFSILFQKLKAAAEIAYADSSPIYELDIASFETLTQAEDAILKNYDSAVVRGWFMDLGQWYFIGFYQ